jgi:hypothetical protein
MPENNGVDQHSVLFMGLVTSFQQNALLALGKMVNPATGKPEKDLNTASAFIDMLDMLKVKTQGNLSSDESKMLDEIIGHLKLNYVDEVNKADSEAATSEEQGKSSEDQDEESKTPDSQSEQKEE